MNKTSKELLKIAKIASNYQFAFAGNKNTFAVIIDMQYKPIISLMKQGEDILVELHDILVNSYYTI